ncbi:MAG: hypothetical protein AAF126_01500 [Chloroflexota bacterium]
MSGNIAESQTTTSVRIKNESSYPESSNPPSGFINLWSNNGSPTARDSAGTDTDLTTGGGGGGNGRNLDTPTELTIASGVITVTGNHHSVDTQSDASSDDLDTINGGSTGDTVVLFANNDSRTVVIKNGTGNILTYSRRDINLDENHKKIEFAYDGTNWNEIGNADDQDSGGGGTMSQFTVDADSGSSETVENNDVLTIAGGEGLASVVSATDTVTINMDINALTPQGSPTGASDYVAIYDAGLSAHRKVLLNDLPSSGGSSLTQRVALVKQTNQAITGGVSTAIQFGASSETEDTDTMHDTVTNNTRITFTMAGTYMIYATLSWSDALSTGNRWGELREGGSTVIAYTDSRGGTASGARITNTLAFMFTATAGQYVELMANSTVGLNILADETTFGAVRVQ